MTAFVQTGSLISRERRTPSGNRILNQVWLELNVIVGKVSEDSMLCKSWELGGEMSLHIQSADISQNFLKCEQYYILK